MKMIKQKHLPKNSCGLCGQKSSVRLYKADGFDIVKCRSCGLVYRNIILDSREAAGLYGESYFTDEQKNYFFNKHDEKIKIFQDRLKRIESVFHKKGKILDIGCAIGTFLKTAVDLGWEGEGVDVSEYAARYAKNHHGLKVVVGTEEEIELPEQSFDVITMWDSIDHLEVPQLYLDKLYKSLKNNGIIVVQTNMEDSLLYRVAHYLYKFSFGIIKLPVLRCHPIHHSTFYSSKTLGLALSRAGFRIIKTESDTLEPKLLNTNWFVKKVMDIINFFGAFFKMPLEITFYAKKN